MLGVFTPEKLANTANPGSFSCRGPVVKYLPAHLQIQDLPNQDQLQDSTHFSIVADSPPNPGLRSRLGSMTPFYPGKT